MVAYRCNGWRCGAAAVAALSLLLQVVFAGLATPSANAAARLAALIDGSLCAGDSAEAIAGSKPPDAAKSIGCCKSNCPMLAGGLSAALLPAFARPVAYDPAADAMAGVARAGAPPGVIAPDATGPPAPA